MRTKSFRPGLAFLLVTFSLWMYDQRETTATTEDPIATYDVAPVPLGNVAISVDASGHVAWLYFEPSSEPKGRR